MPIVYDPVYFHIDFHIYIIFCLMFIKKVLLLPRSNLCCSIKIT